jgi:hypothetical protein
VQSGRKLPTLLWRILLCPLSEIAPNVGTSVPDYIISHHRV